MTETNYAKPPGAYLQEWMEEKGMSLAEAAEEMQYGKDHVRRIIQGKVHVGHTTALRLCWLTSIPTTTWLLHEAGYMRDLERLKHSRVQNALLVAEAEASVRMDRDGRDRTFSLGPQDIVTFSKSQLREALVDVLSWADCDLLKSLQDPEDEEGPTVDDAMEVFLKKLEE
jgi:plasmid maintenance system antidote protein VapI